MENKLYKLLQYSTIGWEETHFKLSRESCEKLIEELLSEGINPNYIKVLSDNNSNE